VRQRLSGQCRMRRVIGALVRAEGNGTYSSDEMEEGQLE
jgi:hypothetical protein